MSSLNIFQMISPGQLPVISSNDTRRNTSHAIMLLGVFEGGTEFPVAGEVPKLQSIEGSVILFQDCQILVLSKFRDLMLEAVCGWFGSGRAVFLVFLWELVRTCSCKWYTFLDCRACLSKAFCHFCDLETLGQCLYAFQRFKKPHSNSSLITRACFIFYEKKRLLFSASGGPTVCLHYTFFLIFSEVTLVWWHFILFYTLEIFYFSFVTEIFNQDLQNP